MWGRSLRKLRYGCSQQPKWMKFFQGYQPIEINIDRSLQNQPSDQLTNFIKQQHRDFDLQYLIRSVEKLPNNQILNQIQGEIIQRLSQPELNLTPQLDRAALLYIVSTDKLDVSKELLLPQVCSHLLFLQDQLNLAETAQVLSFIFEQGFKHQEQSDSFIQKLSQIDSFDLYNIGDMIHIMQVVQYIGTKPENFANIENHFMMLLLQEGNQQGYGNKLIRFRSESLEHRKVIYQSIVKQLDPKNQGIWVETNHDALLKNIFQMLLSSNVPSSDRNEVQLVLALLSQAIAGNKQVKFQQLLRIVLEKFQTANQQFSFVLLKDAFLKPGQSLLELFKFLDQSGFEEIAKRSSNQGHIQKYLQFKTWALDQFQELGPIFSNGEPMSPIQLPQLLEPDEAIDIVPTRYINFLDRKFNQDDAIQYPIDLLLKKYRALLINEFGFNPLRHANEPELEICHWNLENLFRWVNCASILLNEDIHLDKVLTLITCEEFDTILNNYGMVPGLIEDLIMINTKLQIGKKQLFHVQMKMNQIFNKPINQLLIDLADDINRNRKTIESREIYYFNHQNPPKQYHSKVFSIEDDQNYLLKAINSPILGHIMAHTPLKQGWIKNYTIYPAMADFVKDQTAVFVLDAPRLLHGTNDFPDQQTRLSIQYFKNAGYKVITLDHSIYQLNRESMHKEINGLIKKIKCS